MILQILLRNQLLGKATEQNPSTSNINGTIPGVKQQEKNPLGYLIYSEKREIKRQNLTTWKRNINAKRSVEKVNLYTTKK